jgi:transcriptional regulator with XRE-family HTH domain
MDINQRIANKVRALRDEQGLSLDALSERSGVSRSNISLIERAQSSPTAQVLDRLASALGVALASMFDDGEAVAEPSPLLRAAEQTDWTDPASGYVRRNLSPTAPSPLQLVEVRFPAGERVTLDSGARNVELHQQIWMLEGTMIFTRGEDSWRLKTGDCLALHIDCPIVFRNPGRVMARYLVALITQPIRKST